MGVQGVSPCLRKKLSVPDGPTAWGCDSWNNDAANCRTANRNTNDPTNRTNNNGFRLALNSAGKEAIALRLQTEQIVFQSERVLA